ncbi:MAG: hypothetical protein P0Y65_01025 [Candidatus Devosia phytovorans]|uniref:Uncharacterized protein n=1 Tax=Candidatus Devosia phytovorans TaxID=3121372 RepID=A0AAJ6B1W8_9HYPH|nr:hypothetical protein [Devosia sp.]WEK04868.1 MAG: hypothetical protein P0Y65_01025 [Devosia sp.]
MTTISAGAAAGLLVALMVMATANPSHGAELAIQAKPGVIPFQPMAAKLPAPTLSDLSRLAS